jgi:solute:Na+ symporter, SSS family
VTFLVSSALVVLAAYGLYIAALVARRGVGFGDGGADIPGWAVMFSLAGLMVAGVGVGDQIALIGRYGLQAAHPAMGIVLGSMAGLLVHKRLWVAARVAGLATPGEAIGRYYGSVTLRVLMLVLALLFALPFAANLLSGAAQVINLATGGAIPRVPAVWVMSFFLFLPAVVGGWRAIILGTAFQAALLAVAILLTVAMGEGLLIEPGFFNGGIPVAEGIMWDSIPGVIQPVAGIGKVMPQGGIFTAVGVGSTALIWVGLMLSPGMLYLAQTARGGTSGGFGAVWLTAGLGGGLLLVVLPLLAARGNLMEKLFEIAPFAGLGAVLVTVVGAQMTVAFMTSSGSILVTREIVLPFVLPGLSSRGQRLAIRIALATGFFMLAIIAAFAPGLSAVIGSLALPLAVQLLPALLGLCFIRWISRGSVIAGLVFGMLIVFFTEPPGLILFEGLFLELPWGRWPLTVHSAAWGLGFNAGVVLLAAIFTARGSERAL